jgi:hypothetical protein
LVKSHTDIIKAFKDFLEETGACSPYTQPTLPKNYLKFTLSDARNPIYIVNSTDIAENAKLSYKAVDTIIKNMNREFTKIQGMSIKELYDQSLLRLYTPKQYQAKLDKLILIDYEKNRYFMLCLIGLTSFIGIVYACFVTDENVNMVDSLLTDMQKNLLQITKYEKINKKTYLQLTRGGNRKRNRTKKRLRHTM